MNNTCDYIAVIWPTKQCTQRAVTMVLEELGFSHDGGSSVIVQGRSALVYILSSRFCETLELLSHKQLLDEIGDRVGFTAKLWRGDLFRAMHRVRL